MPTTLSDKSATSYKYSIPLFLTLIAAGLAGNYFNFPIFLNIDVFFGSIFAMLALQFFGIGRGILAAAIIASLTYFNLNHPYAIIIMTAEVAVVGWLMFRRKIGMVLADGLFWLIIGIPLIYLFYHIIMHVPLSNISIHMTKQAVNGIANTLIARLIFTGYVLRTRTTLMPYSEIVYNLLAFFVLCPALIFIAVESRTDINETDNNIRKILNQDSGRLHQRLETWVANRKTAILNLADMAASRPPQLMQPYLELVKKSDVNYMRVGLLDKEATSTAFFPLSDELGQNNIGKSFADRPFILQLKQTLKPMLSEVVMGRVGTPKPTVSMLAPVVIRGEYSGYAIGVLSLDQIHEDLEKYAEHNATLYTLLDKNGNIIMTNRTNQTVMTPLVRGKGTLIRLDAGLSQWVPDVPSNTPISERWMKSLYIAENDIGDLAEWKLILEQPVAPFQKWLFNNYTGKLTLLFLILLGALAMAELISRRIVFTLGRLSSLTYELPIRLATVDKKIDWPESGIKEANQLISNFKLMADSLKAKLNEVRQINESLELRVEERTNELRESEKSLRYSEEQMVMTQQIGHTGSWVYYLNSDNIWGSAEALRIFGFPPVAGLILIDDIEACMPKRERVHHALAAMIREEREYNLEYVINPADGSPPRVIYSTSRLEKDAQGAPLKVTSFIQDITERKQIEEEKEEALNRLQKIASRVPGVVYQYRLYPDGSSCFPFASEGIREIYRVSPEEVREDASKVFANHYPDDYDGILTSIQKSARHLTPWCHEYRVKFDDGTVHWLFGNALPQQEADGVVLWHGFITDITERKQAEEELHKKNTEIEQFIYTVSHDLRSPLVTVKSFLGFLEKDMAGNDQEQVSQDLQFIHNAADKMKMLLDELLELSRIDRVETPPIRVSLLEVVTETIDVLAGSIREQKIDIRLPDSDLMLFGDRQRLCQIWQNLIENAIKYRRDDSLPRIELGIQQISGETVFFVKDNGIGIEPRYHSKIFGIFEKLDTKSPGVGIGLSMVQRIVEKCGGRIWVESEGNGKGASFFFTLPLIMVPS